VSRWRNVPWAHLSCQWQPEESRSSWEAASVFRSSAYNSLLPRLIPAAFALLHYVTLSCLVPTESVPVTARNEAIPFRRAPMQCRHWGEWKLPCQVLRADMRAQMLVFPRIWANSFLYYLSEKWCDWRKLHNEELHNSYSSPNIIRIIKSQRMRWAGHVVRMGTGDMHIGYWWWSRKERGH
jgi:hypothetical protein